MGKASISIAVSGSYNGAAIERAQKSVERLSAETAAASDTIAGAMSDSASKAAEFGGSLYNLGEKVSSAGQTLTTGVTVPLAAAGAAAIAAATDFDTAGANIDAACGDAAQSAEALKESGRTLYKEGWASSMTELSSSLTRAREILGDLSETDMTYAVEGALTLEKAFGSDFAETLRGTNVLMDKFGLSATEATDLMVAGTQRGLDYTKELGDNLSEYAGRWADAGLSASEYFSLLEAGAQNGAYNLDKVGDFLNEFLTSLSDGRMEENIGRLSEGTQEVFSGFKDGSKTAQDMLDAVIGELDSMPDSYNRAQIASDLWSSLGEDNAMSMITALADVDDTFQSVAGASEDAADKINDNLGTKATQALRTAQEAVEPFASTAVGLLGEAADTAKRAAEDFSRLDEGTQNLVVGAGLLAAAAGPVLTVGGKITQGAGSLFAAYGKLKQECAVYADAMTTTNAASLQAYQSNEKLNKALYKNPAVKAAGGVSQYVQAVKDASLASSDYTKAVRNLEREQAKGNRSNAQKVASLQAEVTATKQVAESKKAVVQGYRDTASAAKTSTAAIKAQSVAMKAASVAGAALKGVLATAIPIAVISGITALIGHFQEAQEKARTFEQATDGLVSATQASAAAFDSGSGSLEAYGQAASTAKADIDGMLENQAQLAQTISETNSSAAAQSAQLQTAYQAIQQYANQTDLSTEAQGKLRAAVETVNSLCGTQIEVTDAANGKLADESGAIDDVTGSLGKYIDQKLEQIRLDAQEENLRGLYEQRQQNLEELAKAQQAYNDEVAKEEQWIQARMSEYPAEISNKREMAEAAWDEHLANTEAAKSLETTKSLLDSTDTSIRTVEASFGAAAAATDGATQSVKDLAMASPELTAFAQATNKDLTQFSTDLQNAGLSVDQFKSLNAEQLAQVLANWDGTTDSIVQAFADMGTPLQSAGASAAQSAVSGLSSKDDAARQAGQSLGSSAKSGVESVSAYSAGREFGQGYANGIKSYLGGVASAAYSLASSAMQTIKDTQRSGSPSKVTRERGREFGQGYCLGIEDEAGNAAKASAGMVYGAVDAASGTVTGSLASVKAPVNYAVQPQAQSAESDLAALLEEVRALREGLGQIIADNAPRFPSDRDMKRKVQEYVS